VSRKLILEPKWKMRRKVRLDTNRRSTDAILQNLTGHWPQNLTYHWPRALPYYLPWDLTYYQSQELIYE
jgi:hypothetical protein